MIPEAIPSFWARRLPVLPVLLVGALVAAGSFAATSALVGDDDSKDTSPRAATSGIGEKEDEGDAVQPVPGGYQLDSKDVETFQLILVVGDDRQNRLSRILVACAPDGTINGIPDHRRVGRPDRRRGVRRRIGRGRDRRPLRFADQRRGDHPIPFGGRRGVRRPAESDAVDGDVLAGRGIRRRILPRTGGAGILWSGLGRSRIGRR